MKKILLFIVLVFVSGCSGDINQTETKLKIKIPSQSIKEWKIIYDSTSGYNKNYGTLVDNETAFTPFKDVNSFSDIPSPEYLYSDLRGKKLSNNLVKMLNDAGVKLTNDGDGVIYISRPTFLGEGRYILRTYVTFLDKNDKEIATLEVFNNVRNETTSKGIVYKDTGDLMNDNSFAAFCSEKILSVIKRISE